jgi:hypothetical protein
MQWARRATINVEANPELIEGFSVCSVIVIHDFLRAPPFLLSTDGDSDPVLIRSTDE